LPAAGAFILGYAVKRFTAPALSCSCLAMLSVLEQALARHGLIVRGGFRPGPEDALPDLSDGSPARFLLLVGNVGSDLWKYFEDSPERRDGLSAPLDRWTRRVVEALAADFGAMALFPFSGPPYFLFQRWAQRAETVFPSPLGLLVHPAYGLWHAYRAALLLPEPLDIQTEESASQSPCLSCAGKPCLSACPVGAFTREGYDVGACASHIAKPGGRGCLEGGCLARGACPLGERYIYEPSHMAFHMAAFARSRA
jgi:ferredoxin